MTAALEHYTATLAETLLRHESALEEFASPEVRTLFAWHALEESEHKAVAFDVFQHSVDKHWVRVGIMYACHVGFLAGIGAATALSIALDGEARRHPGRLLKSLRGLRTHPFFTREVVRQLRDYDRRDFHPDDSNPPTANGGCGNWHDALVRQTGNSSCTASSSFVRTTLGDYHRNLSFCNP